MTHTNTSNIDISRLSNDRACDAFALACQVFVDASVLHTAMNIGLEEYQMYMRDSFDLMQEQGLSLMATDSETNELVGCLIASDYATQAQTTTAIPDSLKPIQAILQSLDALYQEKREIIPGQVMLVDMAIVNPAVGGRGIYQRLRKAAHQIGQEAGFKRVVGELSSAATQHVCVSQLGQNICAEVAFSSFEYHGQRPFATIKEPPSILLVEGTLT